MNKIDYYRKKTKMSYGKIAKEAGVTASYVCLLAKGERTNPSKETMERIANALGRTVQEVFFGADRKANVAVCTN